MLVVTIHHTQLCSYHGSQVLMMAADALGYYKLALLGILIMQPAPLALTHYAPSNSLILIWFPMWLSYGNTSSSDIYDISIFHCNY